MKNILALISLLALVTLPVKAATIPAPPECNASPYGQEFSVDLFGGVATTDFNNERSFAGFGVNLFLNENFGVGASTSFDEANGQFFENVSLKAIYRVPVGRSAIYGFTGGLRELEKDEWGIALGGGVEHRFAKYLSVFGEIAMEKFVDIDPVAIGKIGIRIPLSLPK